MSRGLQWVIGICVVLLVAAVIFSTVAPFFLPRPAMVASAMPGMGPGYWRGYGFAGPGHMFGGRGMMGFGWRPFLGGGLLLGLVVVAGFVVLGIAWSTRRRSAPVASAAPVPPPAPAVPTTPCAHCGQPLQADWKACPYCGEKV